MDNWVLKPCSDINRMLKIRTDLENFEQSNYPTLLTISHRYATSDDVLFPEPSTLAFFIGFEEKCLLNMDGAVYVAQDIHTGLLDIHIYAADYEKTIYEAIEYLKLKPQYHVEFKVDADKNWNIVETLGE
ncbi:MAG: DUF695 domain-containing protein [Campylobacterota bacterium]|nr:DUF695 domain-containing protein [Campylobacterota bacterium]